MYLQYKNTVKHFNNALLATLLLLIASTSFAGEVGSVGEVVGYATVVSAGGEVRRLKSGDKLEEGDVINAGSDSSVVITLNNGEVVTIGPQASYTIAYTNAGNGGAFAKQSLGNGSSSPTLATGSSAGGSAPVTPGDGPSPTN
ncbi:MAG: hypothetical protein ACI854_000847 [Arenicella sp.]